MEQQHSTISYNPILDTDSYKPSHYLQLPPGAQSLFGYIESRGGVYGKTLFFGLQYILSRYLSTRVTYPMIEEARELLSAHGEPFNEEGWRHIVDQHGGRLPLEIRAVPEGSMIPNHNALVTVRSTDPEVAWLEAYMETMLLRVWYPITVATQSWSIKQVIRRNLEETSDDPEGQLPFKLHDFGARGVSSEESAGIGGMAHLINFMGTDTLSAIRYARAYYDEPMAGYSIPASEHSTITSWGREGEADAYRNMLRQFGGPGKIFACVVDSYDIFNAVENLFGGILKDEIIASQGIVVVRPDSGNPVEMALATAKMLKAKFGAVQNSMGFDVLNNTRIIYGDGINEGSIRGILMELKIHGFAADNIAFGMGGTLLQQVNRDTQKMAMKTSAILMPDGWRDVYKAPITDPGKASKKGLLSTYRNRVTGEIKTWQIGEACADWEDLMRVVWRNGELLVRDSLAMIRERAAETE
ncbi:Putative nicotinate phosphoribosyltransferase (modular protein) [Acidithiobacillus ferrivorans]|uniref:Nicotinamide phosphoribosyltransferase n=1 Tax=Acidithiobacillus ferrivorans TaxID=160808 RepID=A0A060UUL2_9PROT|nr:nicotinate phosphoribosyltransferase [Acidithiobacillus ferrivorans]CDQ10453.1 Nicotinamide phosphoribosyltransferase [Acidithiobacillus ferrivorans]SMH64480.1 Putative nicotinate phosphoribosyltransferase (modular protein) [Acidithiobacillus ferrivorans]